MGNDIPKILIIDDDLSILTILSTYLTKHGFQVQTSDNGKAGIKCFKREKFDIVITDMIMPDISGLDVITAITSITEDVLIFITTGAGMIHSLDHALDLGAIDYFEKPVDLKNMLRVFDHSLKVRNLTRKVRTIKKEQQLKNALCGLVGSSLIMNDIYSQIEKIAQSQISVLIQGETGAGKELAAEAVHKLSDRSDKPFIPVQCGSLPESLLESSLFGYEKGAFTGALHDKPGFFSYAHGGTIFIDEIEVASLRLQAALLRVLDKKEIVPVGSYTVQTVDVRIIAASNENLEELVEQKRFREDLYYRLAGETINMPPLRSRKEDIPMIIKSILSKVDNSEKHDIEFSTHAMGVLNKYLWPGNVRELKNLVINLSKTAPDKIIRPKNLPENFLKSEKSEIFPSLDEHEKELLVKVLQRTNGKKTEAAKILGVARNTIYALIKKHNLT